MNEEENDEAQVKFEPKEENYELNETKFNEDIQNLDSEGEFEKLTKEKLIELLREEKQKLSQLENKLKYSLADYQNLEKKTKSEIENSVKIKIDKFMISFLQIYDDFIRAKTVLGEEKGKQEGLEFILKNMNSLLGEYGVRPIEALGEIFDPNLHEAVSIIDDSTLDDNTITKEIRKGYISQDRVIRPTLVEISKKSLKEKLEGE